MGCHCAGFCRSFAAASYAILFCCCFIILSSSQAAEITLSAGQSIREGQPLISPNNVFALGFFGAPGNSQNRYAGIWYNHMSDLTVVWVANREKPITDSSGAITIGSAGGIIVEDGRGVAVWSANASIPSSSNFSSAVLDDSGNLILQARDALQNIRVVWESFRHPSDTFLPGMEVELNTRTGENELFTSWKAVGDPSPGNFTLGLDPSGTAQIMMWASGRKLWRSGQWDNQIFTGITTMRPLNLNGFKLTNDAVNGKIYLTYTTVDSSTLMRFVMKSDGTVEQLQWSDENKLWSHIWSQPTSPCEFYGRCGAFGICSEDGAGRATCDCMRGFEALPGGGCRRRRVLASGCGGNGNTTDGFATVRGVKLPDSSRWVPVLSGGRSECEQRCRGNCSCSAYAFVNGIGCMLWSADLMDVRTLVGAGNDFYLKLAESELAEGKMSKKIIIIIVVVGAFLLSVFAYALWRWRENVKGCFKKMKKVEKKIPMFDPRPSGELSRELSGPYEFDGEEQGKVPELTYFNFTCVAYATENFLDAHKLGEGGFGPVYKGQLPGGKEIAVKRLSKCSGQGLEEFKNEVILIAKLQHRNLVRLMGCCIQRDERMLIYEYMPNKSLDFFLFDPSKQPLLQWEKRFNIIEGIARGLVYLHRDSRLRIIHRDLKASNILLDGEMCPKISDFGMARIFGGNQNHANTNRVVGTYGYMAPEYAMEGLFSVKSDVYSFGVLVLEIVCGKKNSSTYQHDDENMNLIGHAWKLWNEDKGADLVDPSLGSSYSIRQVLRCIHVGLLCVQDHAADRPAMASIVLMLEGETRTQQYPKPPTFSVGHSREIEPIHTSERYSSNDATMTIIAGR